MLGKLEKILDSYNATVGKTGGKPCACVHGGHGTGKSALLRGLKDNLLRQGANVFFAIEQPSARGLREARNTVPIDDNGAIRELLRQFSRLYGEKVSPDFNKFILSYARGTLAADLDAGAVRMFEKDSLKKFIYDCARAEPTVIIVDDLDRADTFTINLLGDLLKINALSYLVISHCDKLASTALSDMLYRNTVRIDYVELRDIVGLVQSSDDYDNPNSNLSPLLDETVLVLSKPGKERQLIKHYMKTAEQHMKSMAYERAAAELGAAQGVCRSIAIGADSYSVADSDIKALEGDLLIKLGDAQMQGKQTEAAINSFHQALAKMNERKHSATAVLNISRVETALKLADCYAKTGNQDRMCESIMLAEAFFCFPERRVKHYGLYREHIVKYLNLLADLGERVIFREKIKQAYSVCHLDDMAFTASLYFEEGYMLMSAQDFLPSHKLLTQAREIAKELECSRLWDAATNSLAICSEHLGWPDVSRALWRELIGKSFDLAKVAEATVNFAIMGFEHDGDAKKAATSVQTGLDLCILAGDTQIETGIRENLADTPLAAYLR